MGRFASGFTLIELMVTLSIVVIIGLVAVPSYQSSIANNRVSAEVDRVAMDFSFARSEAVKRGVNVAICPTAGCVASSNWDQGWVVFVDASGDLSGINTAANIIKQESAFKGSDTLVPDSSLGKGISFDRSGYTKASGKLILAESTKTTSLRRCVSFSTGSWTRPVGASC